MQLSELRRDEKINNSRRMERAVTDDHIQFLHAFQRAAKKLLSREHYLEVTSLAFDFTKNETKEAVDCDRCGQAAQIRTTPPSSRGDR